MPVSPIAITSAQEYKLEPGTWKYKNVLAAAGPTTILLSTDDGATFDAESDGVFTASGSGLLDIGRGDLFKATIQGGDTLTMSLVRGWGKG